MAQIEKLIPMVDFVLQQDTERFSDDVMNDIHAYAVFLKQSLTLGMFMPVNSDGEVLEEPLKSDYASKPFNESGECKAYFDDLHIYNKAKENVLFSGDFRIKTEGVREDLLWIDSFKDGKISHGLGYYFKSTGKCTDERAVIEMLLPEHGRYFLFLTQTAKNLIYGA